MSGTRKLEDLFLRIFKIAILIFMSLALLLMLGALGNAAWQLSQKPVEPQPARQLPEQDVSLDDLKKELLKDSSSPAPAELAPAAPRPAPNALRYLEEVTRLYRCSTEFARKVGAEIEDLDSATNTTSVEKLRSEMEKLAEAQEHRGDRYIASAVNFTCKAMADTAVIAMRKAGKVRSVFYPVLNFHLKAWDRLAREKADFDEAERQRVESERTQEQGRVEYARALALQSLIAAGVLFAAFMALALYLILARIENNLHDIETTLAVRLPTA